MAAARTCLNCGASIAHRGTRAKTCNTACRKAYERKRATARAVAGVVAEAPGSSGHETESPKSIAKRAVEKEVRALVKPVVREALTEDVLTALQDLVRLTPDAVATLGDQMQGDDAVLAQKAATTVLRYTVGHTALVTPQETSAPQLNINFGLPRPDATDLQNDSELMDSAAEELFTCDVCQLEYPVSEQVANASRCQTCHEARKTAVLAQYGLIDSPA